MELTENELKNAVLVVLPKAKREVWRLEEQLAELRLNKLSPSVINDGMPHGTDQHDLSDYAAKLDEIEQEITAARYRRYVLFRTFRDRSRSWRMSGRRNCLHIGILGG